MPVIFDSAPIFKPRYNQQIAQYLSINKFISMIQKNAMFFCRLDQFEDQFEGLTSKANRSYRKKWWREHQSDFTDEQIAEKINEYEMMEKKIKKLTCANCWNKFNVESVALWKIYSENSQGVIIQSSVSKLIKAVEDEERHISISEVKYVDKINQPMEDGNTNYPIIYKHIAYGYEDEIRLFHEVKSSGHFEYNWDVEEYPKGKYFKTNVRELIDQVIVGPFTEKYVYDIIIQIKNTYELEFPVNWSSLRIEE